jgi:hypothetical protein
MATRAFALDVWPSFRQTSQLLRLRDALAAPIPERAAA